MQLDLCRQVFDADATVGTLTVDGHTFGYTIEKPRGHDLPGQECVPYGLYQLVPHVSARLHDMDGESPLHTWALVNPSLGVTHNPTDHIDADCIYPHRSDILIHPANFAHELLGCIAVGDTRVKARGSNEWMVTNSRLTFQKLRDILGKDSTGHSILIWEQS